LNFNQDLLKIRDPVVTEENDLVKLPGWFKDIVKRKGIPLCEHLTIVPDLSIDLKKKTVESGRIFLKWEW